MEKFKKGDRVVLIWEYAKMHVGELVTEIKHVPGDSEYDVHNFDGAKDGVLLDTEHNDGRGLWIDKRGIALTKDIN